MVSLSLIHSSSNFLSFVNCVYNIDQHWKYALMSGTFDTHHRQRQTEKKTCRLVCERARAHLSKTKMARNPTHAEHIQVIMQISQTVVSYYGCSSLDFRLFKSLLRMLFLIWFRNNMLAARSCTTVRMWPISMGKTTCTKHLQGNQIQFDS